MHVTVDKEVDQFQFVKNLKVLLSELGSHVTASALGVHFDHQL